MKRFVKIEGILAFMFVILAVACPAVSLADDGVNDVVDRHDFPELYKISQEAFDKKKIGFAFPTQTVIVKKSR